MADGAYQVAHIYLTEDFVYTGHTPYKPILRDWMRVERDVPESVASFWMVQVKCISFGSISIRKGPRGLDITILT